MKKLLTLSAVSVFLFSLSACGKSDKLNNEASIAESNIEKYVYQSIDDTV